MIDDFFNKHKGVRRVMIFWSIWLVTVVALRVTEKDILLNISTSGATVSIAIIGILATAINFYIWSRSRDRS